MTAIRIDHHPGAFAPPLLEKEGIGFFPSSLEEGWRISAGVVIAWRACLACFLLFAVQARALELPEHADVPAATASVRAAFTPGDDVAGQLIDGIAHAHRQVLVQAYSFSHDGIARALIDASRRGVEVRLIADREQSEAVEHGLLAKLARAGVTVWLDGDHQSAHNKVLIIDAGTPNAVIITGSFNFTRAAQHKNAENVVFISGNEALVQAYVQNWQRHLAHSQALSNH